MTTTAFTNSSLGLPLVLDGRSLVVTCVELVVYFVRPEPDPVLALWDQSIEALADRLTHYCGGNMRHFAPLVPKAGAMLSTWLRRPRIGHSYVMEVRSTPLGVSDASISVHISVPPPPPAPADVATEKERLRQIYEVGRSIFMPPITSFRVTLPLDHPLAAAAAFRSWISGLDIGRSEAFAGGHAGLAVSHDDAVSLDSLRRPMVSKLAALLARHPGLDWEYPGAVLRKLLRYRAEFVDFFPQVKRVNWLTFVASATLTELRRLSGVASPLAGLGTGNKDDPTSVVELDNGVLIAAQSEPALGDVTVGDPLPAYRRVAAVLQPVRLMQHPPLGGPVNDDLVDRWFNAFDRPLPAGRTTLSPS